MEWYGYQVHDYAISQKKKKKEKKSNREYIHEKKKIRLVCCCMCNYYGISCMMLKQGSALFLDG
ncbi:hypothetical protein M441DRAFT_434724 [Trichoderma asperellum CBS 433.97]|uniref:Uncharacterized protein n=1 Tax=Trichoderma asperellum (strain ATCC 204424 / CBS 433.97 / NBRC 101777) TaxID=1042311 RepID=A0A2T3Z354_TRIA4|nr:hypothetical protein M441DRAFT_434724 [Trichoderma asperellum CBS 433.97]PTB39223.1 hypothetical protein M441DRAFT_434724 [Trichoderma asperellum CBS 433.97]